MRAGMIRLERRDRAERVADMRDRDELAAVEQVVEIVENVEAAIVDRNEAQLGAGSLGEQLPRHEIGVVFELGEQNRVAGFEVRVAPNCTRRD